MKKTDKKILEHIMAGDTIVGRLPGVTDKFDFQFNPRGIDFKSMRYVRVLTVPRTIPKGRVLVHNHVQHTVDTPCGLNGFRAWTQKLSDRLEPCKCGWSGFRHYRLRRNRRT